MIFPFNIGMGAKAILFTVLAAKLVVQAVNTEGSPPAVNTQDPAIDFDSLPASLERYNERERLWQRMYVYGGGCYRGEIEVSWQSEPSYFQQMDGDECLSWCRERVTRDLSKLNIQHVRFSCLADEKPEFKITNSELIKADCPGRGERNMQNQACKCTGLFTQTNILRPKSEAPADWPKGKPHYPRSCGMEDIRKYFVKRLPQDVQVTASRKENNDCPKLRRDHPFIKDFETDYRRLIGSHKLKDELQKKQRAIRAQKANLQISSLPEHDPKKVRFRERKRRNSRSQSEKVKADPILLEEQRKKWREKIKRQRLRRKDKCGPSHTKEAPDNQQTCPEPDTEIADFPREELEQFGTLLTPQLFDKLGPPFDWDLNEPNPEAFDRDLNEPLES
jgi:hypothetical protein